MKARNATLKTGLLLRLRLRRKNPRGSLVPRERRAYAINKLEVYKNSIIKKAEIAPIG